MKIPKYSLQSKLLLHLLKNRSSTFDKIWHSVKSLKLFIMTSVLIENCNIEMAIYRIRLFVF